MSENAAALHGNSGSIEVAGTDLNFRSVPLETESPTGQQIAKAAGFASAQNPYVFQWRTDGDLEEVRPTEEVSFQYGIRFIVAESDRVYRLTIDGDQFDWPARMPSGKIIRALGRVPAEKQILLERTDQPDRVLDDDDEVDLGAEGIERFKTREMIWELNVQGVSVKSSEPIISVADALTRAGFDASQAWIIMLKVKGEAKRQLSISDTVDLRTPGIEKIRLTPKEVNNGEACMTVRRDFSLLDADQLHLDGLGLVWETEDSRGKRWLILHDYPVPSGYSISKTTLALLIPPTYPKAEIDMFYVNPPLKLSSGADIPATQSTENIRGKPFQRWSRHRGRSSRWNPQADNVITHLALVESSIAGEVGQ